MLVINNFLFSGAASLVRRSLLGLLLRLRLFLSWRLRGEPDLLLCLLFRSGGDDPLLSTYFDLDLFYLLGGDLLDLSLGLLLLLLFESAIK